MSVTIYSKISSFTVSFLPYSFLPLRTATVIVTYSNSANYGGNSVTVVAMDNGILSYVAQTIRYERCRDDSHPHQV